MWDMINGYWSIAMAYVCGLFAVRLYRIEKYLYQSGHLEGLWSWYAIKYQGIKGVVDLEGGMDSSKVRKYLEWYRHWPISDGPLPDITQLWDVAREVQRRICQENMKVLVHCGGGVNRASLVNGCVLYLWGYKGTEIVQMIREKRPGALTNKLFEEYLLGLKQEDRGRYAKDVGTK